MKPANYAPVYCALYPQLAEITRTHGYALAIHGSLARDFDLVCIPWVATPTPPQEVVKAITTRFAIRQLGQPDAETGKPDERWTTMLHGRAVTTLSIAFGECFIDLSFMPAALTESPNERTTPPA